jgi:hypothetical protein
LEMARGTRRQDQRLTLITAAGILVETISKTAELEIVDYTSGPPKSELPSI